MTTTATTTATPVAPAPVARRQQVANLLRDEGFMAWVGWICLGLTILYLALDGSTFVLYIGGLATIFAISALGLDWIQGRAGQVSIGSAAFMAIGAYACQYAAERGFTMLPSLAIAALAGAPIGLIVGLPAMRLRGLYLALATLSLQFIVNALSVQYESKTKHSAGFPMPTPSLFGLDFRYGRDYFLFLCAMMVLVIVILRRLYGRAPGRAWLTIKESQIAASVIGINPTKWKLTAFVGSSSVISLSGGLLAYYTRVVSSETYSLNFAITFVVMVIVGGIGSTPGVILGAVIVTASPFTLSEITASIPESLPGSTWLSENVYYVNQGLYGILVLLFLLFKPSGIGGALQDGRRWLIKKLEGPQAVTAAAAPADRIVADRVPNADGTPLADPVLRVENLRVVYRTGACAVDGIDLEVRGNEIVALLGRNGAGKTSTLRAISGFFVSEGVRLSGSIKLGDRDIRSISPIAASKRGVVLVPERDKVFPNLTVAEHLRIVNPSKSTVDEVLALFPRLQERQNSQAGLLSGGERQMLALGVAFCMKPRLLLIDELSLGLAPALIKRLVATLHEYQISNQVPILLVEQNVGAALELADRVYVLEGGRIESAGSAQDLSREALIASSLGG